MVLCINASATVRPALQEFAGFLRAFLGWSLVASDEGAEPKRSPAAAVSPAADGAGATSAAGAATVPAADAVASGGGGGGGGGSPNARAWAELAKHVDLGRPGMPCYELLQDEPEAPRHAVPWPASV